MVKMWKGTFIVFGLTMVICLALFFYCWYIRKLRYRLTSVQVSDTPDEVHMKTGLEKHVVDSFPTVKTHELKVAIKEELQCPICLVEYGDAETLRQLPHCNHVFHIHCVDAWFANQTTCPVCRIELSIAKSHGSRESISIDVPVATPAWVLVNRPFPLPPVDTKPALGLGVGLHHEVQPASGWGSIFLQTEESTAFSFRSPSDDIAIIQSKDCISHSSISERWMTESFSFGIDHESQHRVEHQEHLQEENQEENQEAKEKVAELYRCYSIHDHLPLTASPEHCVFEFLPVVTADSSSSNKSR